MTPFPPPLTTSLVDSAPAAPALLAGTHYPLGRALALILVLALAAYALLTYACGRCTRRFTRGLSALDAFASATVIVGAAPRGSGAGQDLAAFRAIKHTTPFGGALTLVAALFAAGLCLDVLQQYAADAGVEAPALLPPPSLAADGVAARGAWLLLQAVQANASAGAAAPPCSVGAAQASAALQGAWALTATSRTAASGGGGGVACSFTFSSAAPLLASGFADPTAPAAAAAATAAAAAAVPSLRVVLGPGLALASWSLYLGDAKATAGTVGGPAGPVPVGVATLAPGANASDAAAFSSALSPAQAALGLVAAAPGAGALVNAPARLHTAGVQVMSSTRVDNTYAETPSGALVSYGLRFSALSYAVEAASGDWQGSGALGGDALLLVFSRAPLSLVTAVHPRISALVLLGVLCGLAGGAFALLKAAHDCLDGSCALARREREAELAELAAMSADAAAALNAGVSPQVRGPRSRNAPRSAAAFSGPPHSLAPPLTLRIACSLARSLARSPACSSWARSSSTGPRLRRSFRARAASPRLAARAPSLRRRLQPRAAPATGFRRPAAARPLRTSARRACGWWRCLRAARRRAPRWPRWPCPPFRRGPRATAAARLTIASRRCPASYSARGKRPGRRAPPARRRTASKSSRSPGSLSARAT